MPGCHRFLPCFGSRRYRLGAGRLRCSRDRIQPVPRPGGRDRRSRVQRPSRGSEPLDLRVQPGCRRGGPGAGREGLPHRGAAADASIGPRFPAEPQCAGDLCERCAASSAAACSPDAGPAYDQHHRRGAGMFDVASRIGIPHHTQRYGHHFRDLRHRARDPTLSPRCSAPPTPATSSATWRTALSTRPTTSPASMTYGTRRSRGQLSRASTCARATSRRLPISRKRRSISMRRSARCIGSAGPRKSATKIPNLPNPKF